jgi:hypothetical protein
MGAIYTAACSCYQQQQQQQEPLRASQPAVWLLGNSAQLLKVCLLTALRAGAVSSNSSSHHQQVILQFAAALPLPPLQPVLRLGFSYTLLEGLDGFYRSSFIGEQML